VKIESHGLAVDLPSEWEGRIRQRTQAGPVLHLATFPLLASDGDFGAAATGRMRPDDVFAALLEYRSDARIQPGRGLFEQIARPLPQAHEFDSRQLQVTRHGQLGWQRFFTEHERTCCLYAVIQPRQRRREALVDELRAVLATIELSA
jgi:hypothetical protein